MKKPPIIDRIRIFLAKPHWAYLLVMAISLAVGCITSSIFLYIAITVIGLVLYFYNAKWKDKKYGYFY